MPDPIDWCRWLADVDADDTPAVGGKNASLGEMLRELGELGVRVPDGFATTAEAYRRFVAANELDAVLDEQIGRLRDGTPVDEVGAAIRDAFTSADLPGELADAVADHYARLGRRVGDEEVPVAARSSATAEDLPEASFAGQQETFLNVRGVDALLNAVRRCYASLFTDRAIAYREEHDFDHRKVALSVGVQQMVRSDEAGAGVMFSVDTETGFPDVVVIDAAWGLGESVVSGTVDPDEYQVFSPLLERDGARPIIGKELGAKERRIVYATDGDEPTAEEDTPDELRRRFVLTDDQILELAHHAATIERHYGRPMDMEWAQDGPDGPLFVVQARPETAHGQRVPDTLRSFRLSGDGEPLATGEAIGQGIAAGPAHVLSSPDEGDGFPDDGVLVTSMTDPDWVPLMKRAAAIVTDHGGRTSHAAIVSRELGLPAVIGTGDGTERLGGGEEVTVSCAEGAEGVVYAGRLDWEEQEIDLRDVPDTRTEVMLNLADPGAALRWWRLPADGVGLARMEFVVGNHVQVHPMALLHPDRVGDDDRRRIDELTAPYDDPTELFVSRVAHGVARIAASQHPRPVIVRLSDFKTNEYADLIGGAPFEPEEENPMLGWRGASRYHDERYAEGFALECRALRRVREDIGLDNVVIMVPFCRTLDEADAVLGVLAEHGLVRGRDGLQVFVMAEIPANVWLAEDFAARFDGFSIGSNDLTQLVLGVDRDSERLGDLFSERDPAVVTAIEQLIERAHAAGAKVGLCGQAPSDDPEFAEILVRAGIDSISVSPDSFLAVKRHVAAVEQRLAEATPAG